jgi:hypothetical protein
VSLFVHREGVALAEGGWGMLEKSESTLLETTPERRAIRRFDMRLPASVTVEGADIGELLTETQNVSARGVFLYLDRPLARGSRIHVTLTFPPHVTLTDPVRVRFSARVERVEAPLPASRVGIAAVIEHYEFLRSGALGSA